ncbi:secreted RxLR effector protein 161-like [Mercurialis annua]|uniref:secreted RxLR effector protein 161-like n=1 Tax=Mercurialis annua TaxID=3986 RepID=UPI00216097CC|nr:secreted RxLR effector protein 161-like [Mercurialis annua]
MDGCKTRKTPMPTNVKIDKDESGKNFDEKKYQGMIGSLPYLTASRPDIMFSVCLCARFQSCPKECNYFHVKRIFKYLMGTQHLGLWYPRKNPFDLVSYLDADYAGSAIDRKSTSGTCQFLGNCVVSWHSKKQVLINLSKNPIQHSRSKHIDIRHHFMRDHVQLGDVV